MTTVLSIGGRPANRATKDADTASVLSGHIIKALGIVFPDDTVKSLARVLGIPFDTANNKVHGRRNFSADELAVLLRTDDGFEFLTAIMADAQPQWWRLVSGYMQVRDVQRLQAEARAKLRRAVRDAINADTDLTAAIARADAFSDTDFHQPHADALRTMARVPDLSMAPAAGKTRR